jgi:cytochrome bd-type quinol oxidase subunit 2
MKTVNGLPAHVLLVHAIVVLLPLSALLLVLTAASPAIRRRLAGPNAILSVLVVLLVPLTTSAGEWLESRVPQSATLHQHTELGDSAIFYALPIAALAVVIWWLQRRQRPTATAVTGVLMALSLVAGAAGVYGIYRIGDSGAKAAWSSSVSQNQSGEHTPR